MFENKWALGFEFFSLALLLHLEFISKPSHDEQRAKNRQNFLDSDNDCN